MHNIQCLLCLFIIAYGVVNAQEMMNLGLSPGGGVSSAASNEVTYTVLVNNDTNDPIDVYFFTSPAIFDGKMGEYTNSLGSQTVQPGTSQASFTVTSGFYAAAQRFENPPEAVQTTSVALVPIGINTDKSRGGKTVLSFDKHQEAVLSIPQAPAGNSVGAVPGAFQIETPPYPNGQGAYGIGVGHITQGKFALASYILSRPGMIVNVQPVIQFYISTGDTQKGADANYYSRSTSSALCDATTGTTEFLVRRTNDGRWSVNGVLQ